jgi:nucleoside-diphosphate-sugar epimerase
LKNKKKILVIGGTGFIGYHLIKRCLQKSYNVTCISSRTPSKKKRFSNVKYLICDIRDKKKLSKIITSSYNFVVNLGGYVDHSKKKKTLTSHYDGCKNLVKILLKFNIENFIQIGSGLEYGNRKSPQKENLRCSPKSTYGLAKFKATNFLMQLSKKNKFHCTILRLYQAYGPKQDFNRLIPIVIKSCLKKERFACSEGFQKRDFLYIDDLIDLIFKIFSNKRSRGRIFNAGSGKPIKIKNLIEKIKKISKGGIPEYGKIKMRKDEIDIMYPNIKLSRKILNWSPKVTLDNGLKKTVKFYREKY